MGFIITCQLVAQYENFCQCYQLASLTNQYEGCAGEFIALRSRKYGRSPAKYVQNDWGPVELEQTITLVFLLWYMTVNNPYGKIPTKRVLTYQSIWIYLETTLPCNNRTYFWLIVYHIVCFQRLLNMPVQSPLYRWVKQCRRSPRTWTPIHTEFRWVSAQESHRMLMIMMWLDLSSEHWILMAGKNLEKFCLRNRKCALLVKVVLCCLKMPLFFS